MEELKQFAIKRGTKLDAADFTRDEPWIREQLREALFTTTISKIEADRIALDFDTELQKGIASLPQSKALIEKSKAIIARGSFQHQ